MNKRLLLITLTMGLASAPLYATEYNRHGGFQDKARVVDVTPIYEMLEVPAERRECWDEEVHRNCQALVGQRIALEEPGYELEVKRVVPDFSIEKNNQVVSRTQEPRNPAAQLALFKDGSLLEEKWIFAKFPDFHGSGEKGPYQFSLLNYSAREYTGLQLTMDPGVWVVWLGCILLCAGCYIICFLSHQRLWVKVEPKKDDYSLTMAGTSSKNMLSFSQTFARIHQDLKRMDK